MLSILDRYILKKYLGTFFFIILLFSMLAAVIDYAEKVEDFVGEKAPSGSQIIFDYYLNFIPFINSLLFPLYTLITVIFFTSRLAGNSEIIGMLGNGVNFYRIFVPYLIGGGIITGIHFVGNHYIFPISSKTRVQFENTYIWKNNFDGPTENLHFSLNDSTEAYIKTYNRRDSTGVYFSLIRYDSRKTRRPIVIDARNIQNLGGQKWRLADYKLRYTNGLDEGLITKKNVDTLLGFSPADLVRRDNSHQAMTTPELIAYIEKERDRGLTNPIMFEVERHRRSADPFTNLILTVIGFSIASYKARGGMGWHLVIGVSISGVFIFMTKFSTTFATNAGFSPFWAMWTPNILFSLVALWMLLRVQK
jgi:lipopolysaccharide export system permease protein